MPEQVVLLDAGPLVAFLSERDSLHGWAVEQFSRIPAPMLTCEAVLAEAFHLLRRGGSGQLFELLERGAILVDFSLSAEHAAVAALVKKYRDVPMSLADACLVRMADLHPSATVLTFDAEFRIYRKNRRQRIPLLIPPDR